MKNVLINDSYKVSHDHHTRWLCVYSFLIYAYHMYISPNLFIPRKIMFGSYVQTVTNFKIINSYIMENLAYMTYQFQSHHILFPSLATFGLNPVWRPYFLNKYVMFCINEIDSSCPFFGFDVEITLIQYDLVVKYPVGLCLV